MYFQINQLQKSKIKVKLKPFFQLEIYRGLNNTPYGVLLHGAHCTITWPTVVLPASESGLVLLVRVDSFMGTCTFVADLKDRPLVLDDNDVFIVPNRPCSNS